MDADERFNALYQAHAPAVLRYACRRADPDTARDVVAETFLVAWRRLAAVPSDPAQAEPWLYRWDLATNKLAEQLHFNAPRTEAYTPTLIGADGTVYAMNNATPVRHRPLAQDHPTCRSLWA